VYSVATCVNDEDIPEYLKTQLADLKKRQKMNLVNLPESEGDSEGKPDEDGAGADVPIIYAGEEEEREEDSDGDGGDGPSEPPAKCPRLSRSSTDAHIVEVGRDLYSKSGRGFCPKVQKSGARIV
jgi:hypothetical protein